MKQTNKQTPRWVREIGRALLVIAIAGTSFEVIELILFITLIAFGVYAVKHQ
jgi:hypothetical protein